MRKLERLCPVVDEQLAELAAIAASPKRLHRRGASSGWSVKGHVEHLVLAGGVMLTHIETACSLAPADQLNGRGPTPIGRIVLALQRIPRGRGKAPDFTVPCDATIEDLCSRVDQMRMRATALRDKLPLIAQSRHQSAHPVLGDFTAAQWLRFLKIHQQHHLEIIKEIERWAESISA